MVKLLESFIHEPTEDIADLFNMTKPANFVGLWDNTSDI